MRGSCSAFSGLVLESFSQRRAFSNTEEVGRAFISSPCQSQKKDLVSSRDCEGSGVLPISWFIYYPYSLLICYSVRSPSKAEVGICLWCFCLERLTVKTAGWITSSGPRHLLPEGPLMPRTPPRFSKSVPTNFQISLKDGAPLLRLEPLFLQPSECISVHGN